METKEQLEVSQKRREEYTKMAYLDRLQSQVAQARAEVNVAKEAIRLQSIRSNRSRIDPSSPTRLSIGERLLQHRMEVPLMVSPYGDGSRAGSPVPLEGEDLLYDEVIGFEGKSAFASGWGPGGLSGMMSTGQGARSMKGFGSRY